jgi:hypothetical protein
MLVCVFCVCLEKSEERGGKRIFHNDCANQGPSKYFGVLENSSSSSNTSALIITVTELVWDG